VKRKNSEVEEKFYISLSMHYDKRPAGSIFVPLGPDSRTSARSVKRSKRLCP
jgi:hypothetical protein